MPNLYHYLTALILISICSSVSANDKHVTMEGYTIHKCYECEINPPLYEEITEIYHVDDELTELTLTVAGDCFMKDSLTLEADFSALHFNYNFKSSPDQPISEGYCWYTIKVLLENFKIPNEYLITAEGLEIFISDEIYFNYISSYELIWDEPMNFKDYYGRKQGAWVVLSYYNIPESELFYVDDVAMVGYHSVFYDMYGRLASYTLVEDGVELETEEHYPSIFFEPEYVPYSLTESKE